MPRKSRGSAEARKVLTPVELEMMNVIWQLGSCSVAQVMERLRPERELAYTSVSTIIRILEQKAYVTSRKEGRGHLYRASVTKEEYQAMSLNQLVRNVFEGTPSLLVQRLLDSESVSARELAQIRNLLTKKGS